MSTPARSRASARAHRRNAGEVFLNSVRGWVPAAQQLLVLGLHAGDGVEGTVELRLKQRGEWQNIDDPQIDTVMAVSRESFQLGVAYGQLLNTSAVLKDGAR